MVYIYTPIYMHLEWRCGRCCTSCCPTYSSPTALSTFRSVYAYVCILVYKCMGVYSMYVY